MRPRPIATSRPPNAGNRTAQTLQPHAMKLRAITHDDYDAVARLICESTNRWYAQRNMGPIFTAGPAACRVFTDVYEALDPGCCVVAVDDASGRLMGSCFYHPRETHLSLGIMNVHPDFFGHGVAR